MHMKDVFCSNLVTDVEFLFRFFTYGNFPLTDHLEYINDKYLQHFDRLKIDTTVPAEQRWAQPVSVL